MVTRKGEEGIAVLLSLFYTLLVLGLVLTSISGRRVSPKTDARFQVQQAGLMHLCEAGLARALHELRQARSLDRVVETQWSLSYSMGEKLWGSVDVTLDKKAWLLDARARVHERSDEEQGLDDYPNRLLARARAQVKLGRIRFRPPAKAALVMARPSLLRVDSNLVFLTAPGEVALAYIADGEELPELPAGSLAMELAPERLRLGLLLGIQSGDLPVIADRYVPEGEPFLEMQWGLIHLRGERRFDAEHPLRGSGFLIVDGDLILQGDVMHEFQGILLVTGSLRLRGQARLEGMTIVREGLWLEGDETGLSLQFDEEAMRRSLWSVDGIRFFGRPQVVMESLDIVKPVEASR